MFLLDTNVISELRKLGDGKADGRVAAWISSRDAASFYLSALTLMELEIGILRIERRDAAQGERLRTWMDRHVLPEFLERTLPVDSAVALKCARLHVPDPRAERDALIAATALVYPKRNRFAMYRQAARRSFRRPSCESMRSAGANTPSRCSQRKSLASFSVIRRPASCPRRQLRDPSASRRKKEIDRPDRSSSHPRLSTVARSDG